MIMLLLVPYWRWRSRGQKRSKAPSASISNCETPSLHAGTCLQEPSSPYALLQEGDVVIAVDKKGSPHKLGNGTYGEV